MQKSPPARGESQETGNASHREATDLQISYLASIYEESLKNDGIARGCNIAKEVGVSRSTVALTLRALKKMGYVQYDPYGPLRLTEKGKELGKHCLHNRDILRTFFLTVMKLPESSSLRLAVELENIADEQTIQRFERFNGFFGIHGKDFLL